MAAPSEASTFGDEQQQAALGHALKKAALWPILVKMGVTAEWFVDLRCGKAWDLGVDFYKKFRRYPTADELKAEIHDDPVAAASYRSAIDRAVAAAGDTPLDVLRIKFSAWMRDRIIAERTTEIERLFNAGERDKAARIVRDMGMELERAQLSVGAVDHFEPATVRVRRAEARRESDAQKTIHYGVQYLDDALCGMIPNELVLVGGRSQAGKTELVKNMAENICQTKRVSVFALEAEEGEYESRMQYKLYAQRWHRDNPGSPSHVINYPAFRHNQLKELLKPYRDDVLEEFDRRFKNLQTFYRLKDNFNVSELERQILQEWKNTDVFVLDHFHYVDAEGDADENREALRLTKTLRDMAISIGVPIIVVAHVRKAREQRRQRTLVPDLEDFHGSGNIGKIATTAIMLSSASNLRAVSPDFRDGYPTFFQITKCRLDNTRSSHTGVLMFRHGGYAEGYAVGKLNSSWTEWTQCTEMTRPYWATHATLGELEEID